MGEVSKIQKVDEGQDRVQVIEQWRQLYGCSPPKYLPLGLGLGLAMAYAGPAQAADWAKLMQHFPRKRAVFAQGTVFAATAQAKAGYFSTNMEFACETLMLGSPFKAAELSEECRPLPQDWQDQRALIATL